MRAKEVVGGRTVQSLLPAFSRDPPVRNMDKRRASYSSRLERRKA
jgi:hypothetical protein